MIRFFERAILGIMTFALCIGVGVHLAQATALVPAVTDVVLQSGATTTTRISIGRDEPGAGDYVVSILPFHPSADGHTIEWLTEADARSLQTRVTLSQNAFRLLEGEAKMIDVTMTAPTSTVQQGNEFVGVLISTKQTQASAVSTRLASLFFVSFPAQARPRFVATDMHMESGLFGQPSSSRGARITVQNQGTGYGIPTGTFVTRNLFGNVVMTVPMNPTENRVLAHASKPFQVHLDGFLFGRYTTRLEQGNVEQADIPMIWWVFPKSVLIVFPCLLLSGVFIAIRKRKT